MSVRASMPVGVTVEVASKERLRDCERLTREVFGWDEANVLPAWIMYTAGLQGGLILSARVGEELVGCSCGLPGYDGHAPFLYSIGLAVRPGFEGCGIARLLKLAQREIALDLGYRTIKWTVDPLASRPVYLYLTVLHAELVGYAAEMYEGFGLGGLDAGIVADEAEMLWDLVDDRPVRPTPVGVHADLATITQSTPGPTPTVREFCGLREFDPTLTCFVELPWDIQELKAASLNLAGDWRYGVRTAMQELLELGRRGAHVVLDRNALRSFVSFPPESERHPV